MPHPIAPSGAFEAMPTVASLLGGGCTLAALRGLVPVTDGGARVRLATPGDPSFSRVGDVKLVDKLGDKATAWHRKFAPLAPISDAQLCPGLRLGLQGEIQLVEEEAARPRSPAGLGAAGGLEHIGKAVSRVLVKCAMMSSKYLTRL